MRQQAQQIFVYVGNWPSMDDFMREDERGPESPSLYISGLSPPQPEELLIPKGSKEERKDEALTQRLSLHSTVSSEKEEKRRLAGMRSREKKKQYLEELERSVRDLTNEVAQTEDEIKQCKDKMEEVFRTQSSAHQPKMRQLERQVGAQDPDLDQINLLLDVIKSRLGADAKERISTMEYNFKQIINSLFPALHRYLMYHAVHEEELFNITLTPHQWTEQLFKVVEITPQQHRHILNKRTSFAEKRNEAVRDVIRLKQLQANLEKEAHIFEQAMHGIRTDMEPVQAANVLLFGHKNRFRWEFAAPGEQRDGAVGRKRVKQEGV